MIDFRGFIEAGRRPMAAQLTIVAPFFNEEAGILKFCEELREHLNRLPIKYDVILVNDGSTDRSIELLCNEMDWAECEVLSLSKNFGHQAALDAGIRHAKGDFIVTMDSDLQHPPSIIGNMLDAAQDGYDVVYAVRPNRSEDSKLKRLTSRIYYAGISSLTGVRLVPNAADFRLMSRKVVDQLNLLDEEKVFRLLIPNMGYKSISIPFQASSRVYGETKYTFQKMLKLAVNSTVMFSAKPLTIVGVCGILISALAALLMCFNLWEWSKGNVIPGWTSVTLIVLFMGGIQLLALGIIGIYLGKLLEISKKRPHSYIADKFLLGDRSSKRKIT